MSFLTEMIVIAPPLFALWTLFVVAVTVNVVAIFVWRLTAIEGTSKVIE